MTGRRNPAVCPVSYTHLRLIGRQNETVRLDTGRDRRELAIRDINGHHHVVALAGHIRRQSPSPLTALYRDFVGKFTLRNGASREEKSHLPDDFMGNGIAD